MAFDNERNGRMGAGLEGARGASAGFTLIELLVVIVILGILAAVAVTVASKVTSGGRVKLSQEVLKVCDQTLTAAAASLETKAPSKYVDVAGNEFPIVDGRANSVNDFTAAAEPTVALYFLTVAKLPGLDDMFKGLDAKLVQRESSIVTAFGTPDTGGLQPLVVRDGFGRPVRYVNSTYHGGYGAFFNGTTVDSASRKERSVKYKNGTNEQSLDMRRSYRPFPANGVGVGDADEGLCPGGTAYFYSAGSDGDPGTRDDNAYTTRPSFPLETTKFGQ
jgi:prepilin-type N-terminal cleavage/methylation domain-containing protein